MGTVKIATFNTNSVNRRLHILEPWLSGEDAPDIICIQETKAQDKDFPNETFEKMGYNCYYKGMKSYNGVAIISKIKADEIAIGLGDGNAPTDKEESENARVIRAKFGKLDLVNTYIPQGKAIDNPDYPYKLDFFSRVKNLFDRISTPDSNLLWVGDLNVAPTDIDVTNPKTKKNHSCFHIDVKNAFYNVMKWGLKDIFRKHLPDEGIYTFWDYRVKNALDRNIGWRIDHIIGTDNVYNHSIDVSVRRDFRAMETPSDHTAVVAIFDEAILK